MNNVYVQYTGNAEGGRRPRWYLLADRNGLFDGERENPGNPGSLEDGIPFVGASIEINRCAERRSLTRGTNLYVNWSTDGATMTEPYMQKNS